MTDEPGGGIGFQRQMSLDGWRFRSSLEDDRESKDTAPENWTKTVTCVGGYLLAIRRHLFEQLEPTILNRNWYGEDIIEGK